MNDSKLIKPDAWEFLKTHTDARIALGSVGTAMPLAEVLAFKMAHAHARDAVYSELNESALIDDLATFDLPIYTLQSQVNNRHTYLQRPDWGRKLSEASKKELAQAKGNADIAFIMADGLSATAINKHAFLLLKILIPLLQQAGFSIAPLSIVRQGRVAIGDDIGETLQAKCSVVLIGERPGLSSPDSMGAYLTYQPKVGLTDESRNCVSNIRSEGLSYQTAAEKIFYLIQESFRLQYSGVSLKDNTDSGLLT
ncbi:MAG: ethanolamine ammonia-lyase subunit EutC [Saprospiraceae bacterium]|nr:ethanolamine ammonia-lyase subunit EutC [Saprospiraceae bacterium]